MVKEQPNIQKKHTQTNLKKNEQFNLEFSILTSRRHKSKSNFCPPQVFTKEHLIL